LRGVRRPWLNLSWRVAAATIWAYAICYHHTLGNAPSSTMKLHILSDLHLRFGDLTPPATDADIVILAGDIGRPSESVRWAYGLGKPVLFVPGNHEFYGGVIGQVLTELKGLCAGTDVHVLDDDEFSIQGVRFLGCTLWTDLSLYGMGPERDLAVRAAWQHMRDFTLIRVSEKQLFTPKHMMARYAAHISWLTKQLARETAEPTVVITHHAPSPLSIHKSFAGHPINAAYITNLEHLFGAERVRLWIHGHTHFSFDYVHNGTRVVCNPRGYVFDGTNQNRQFDPGLVIEI
jgi:predicted phosphodiesterase